MRIDSPQKYLGTWVVNIIPQATSNMWRFLFSAMSFCWGILTQELCWKIQCSLKYYPRWNWNTLVHCPNENWICVWNWIWIIFWNCLKTISTSYLSFPKIKPTYMRMIANRSYKPFCSCNIIYLERPQMLLWISENGLLDLYGWLEYGARVCLANWQTTQQKEETF